MCAISACRFALIGREFLVSRKARHLAPTVHRRGSWEFGLAENLIILSVLSSTLTLALFPESEESALTRWQTLIDISGNSSTKKTWVGVYCPQPKAPVTGVLEL